MRSWPGLTRRSLSPTIRCGRSKSALAIREAVAALHTELPQEAHLDFGVGIHYGEAILGWIGTEKRLEYTAISDSVNTTKRIQENSAKNQILISREAYDRVKDEISARPFVPSLRKRQDGAARGV